MQYVWNTVLKRVTNYEDETPKNLFGQLDIHKKVNGLDKNENENEVTKVTYIDELL